MGLRGVSFGPGTGLGPWQVVGVWVGMEGAEGRVVTC